MPKFSYKAKRGPTEIINGVVEAEHLNAAIEQVIRLGYTPLDVVPLGAVLKSSPVKTKEISFGFSQRIKFSELTLLTRQWADLFGAGVPLLRVLDVSRNQIKNPALKNIIEKIYLVVQDGGSLSAALMEYPRVFSPLYVNMVRSGETGGNLDLVLQRLAEFTEQEQETRSKVISSLVYPGLMLLVGILTISVLLTFVIPRLTVMFEDMAQTLPLPTLILIRVSNFFLHFWWLILVVIILVGFYFKRYRSSPEGRLRLDTLQLRIPLIGQFIINVEMGRFARTLGSLLKSGITIVTALESVWAILSNEALKKELANVTLQVSGGKSLTAALKECRFFSDMAISMVSVGEESGRLEESLNRLADSYEKESDRFVKTFTSLLEPLMIVVIGSVVGFIVISMLLPIFKMDMIMK